MFKKKKKSSNKNDEIYVDYSKDIDVKKTEDDEAIPEHYDALKVDDDVVVSKGQIREAVHQKVQNEYIESKKREAAKQKELEENSFIDEEQTDDITQLEEQVMIDSDNDKDYDNETEIKHTTDDAKSYPNTVLPNIETNEEQRYQKNNTVVDVFDDQPEFDDDFDAEDTKDVPDDEAQHRSYPSFLHEELNVRRKLKPIQEQEEVKEEEQEELLEEESTVKRRDIDFNDEKEETVIEDVDDEIQDDSEKKQDLDSFFGNDSSVLKRGAIKHRRKEKKQHKEHTKTPLYQYKHHLFYSMEEFTMFLQANYKDLEEIAQDVLKDERFFRWLKEESTQFEESIVRMKNMKQDLKQ